MYNSKFWELAFKDKIKILFLTINQLIENKLNKINGQCKYLRLKIIKITKTILGKSEIYSI